MKRFFQAIRTHDWWEYKFPPMLALAYIVMLKGKATFVELYPSFLLVLVALVIGAAFVSMLNDATDIREDKLAGKQNKMEGFKKGKVVLLVFIPLVLALILTCFFFRRQTLTWVFYLLSFTCFTLYSLPPFRFKKRGFAGVLTDALGSQVFPSLFITSYFLSRTHGSMGLEESCFLVTWLLCVGLRGILWHQISDAENDRKSKVSTFIQTLPASRILLAGRVLIGAELVSFSGFIFINQLTVVYVSLILYFFYLFLLYAKWKVRSILIDPGSGPYRILMFEYYQVFFPLAILCQLSINDPVNLLALATHLLLFPTNTWNRVHELKRLLAG